MKNISFVLWLVLYPLTFTIEYYFYFFEYVKFCEYMYPITLVHILFYVIIATCIYEKY